MHAPNHSLKDLLPQFGLLNSNMEEHTRNNTLRLAQRKKRLFFLQKTAVFATLKFAYSASFTFEISSQEVTCGRETE